jgi:hypothetical protein
MEDSLRPNLNNMEKYLRKLKDSKGREVMISEVKVNCERENRNNLLMGNLKGKSRKKEEKNNSAIDMVKEFAHATQKGFASDKPHKVNQDTFIISPNIDK